MVPAHGLTEHQGSLTQVCITVTMATTHRGPAHHGPRTMLRTNYKKTWSPLLLSKIWWMVAHQFTVELAFHEEKLILE